MPRPNAADGTDHHFVLNHTADEVVVDLGVTRTGVDLLDPDTPTLTDHLPSQPLSRPTIGLLEELPKTHGAGPEMYCVQSAGTWTSTVLYDSQRQPMAGAPGRATSASVLSSLESGSVG